MLHLADDNNFIIMESVHDKRWRWHWLAGTVGAGVVVEGTRSYPTKAAATRGAKASIRRLIQLCARLAQGDMV